MAIGRDEVEATVNWKVWCYRKMKQCNKLGCNSLSLPLLSTMFFLLRPLSSLRYLGRWQDDNLCCLSRESITTFVFNLHLSNWRSMYLMISLNESVLSMASPKPGVSTTVSLNLTPLSSISTVLESIWTVLFTLKTQLARLTSSNWIHYLSAAEGITLSVYRSVKKRLKYWCCQVIFCEWILKLTRGTLGNRVRRQRHYAWKHA